MAEGEAPQIEYYFDDKLIFLIKHPHALRSEELARNIAAWLQTSETAGGKLGPPNPEAILTFPFRMPNDANFVLSLVPVPLIERSAATVAQLFQRFFSARREEGIEIVPGVTIQAATPNFVAGGSTHQIGIGGPGWEPEAAAPAGNVVNFDLTTVGLNPIRANEGAGIRVAILDTAPSMPEAAMTLAEFQPNDHPLAERLLLTNNPKLNIHPATFADLLSLGTFTMWGQRYLMADHGLFVAGIINSIVPEAELHLYEVLSPYGVGSIETIVEGMFKAVLLHVGASPAGTHLIINCSLAMVMPANLQPEELTYANIPLEWICNLLQANNVTIVAASGNLPSIGNPGPSYPASFASVISVGSVATPLIAATRGVNPPAYVAAAYSNAVTKPQGGEGYLTYGGESGAGNGMLGVYLGNILSGGIMPLPEDQRYKANPSGWARWAGTSFATAVLSGVIALQAGRRGMGVTTATTIADLNNASAVAARPSVGGINVLNITQQ
jgi:subtilase family protein